MTFSTISWTEQLYRYAEHLYWAPQDINKKTPPGQGGMDVYEKVRGKIRNNEVPLNLLFNIFVHLSPTRIKNQLLAGFVGTGAAQLDQKIELINLYNHLDGLDFIQPDMVLESDQARVCLELKVNHTLSLEQIYKYLFLHGLWRAQTGVNKTPYLLLLIKRAPQSQWKPTERQILFSDSDDLAGLYHYLMDNDLPVKFGLGGSLDHLHAEVRQVIDELRLGWSSWQSIGDTLQGELETLDLARLTDDGAILLRLMSGFLAELERRKLWRPKP